MKEFGINIIVEEKHLDELEHVNNVCYVQWVQEVAKRHWERLTDTQLRKKYVWVVLSHHIQYKASSIFDDELEIKTYVTQSQGVTSTRIVEIYKKEGNKLIVKAETKWCLLDRESKKPIRIPQEIKNMFDPY